MTVKAFQARIESGGTGHVGLPESMGMLFDTLGMKLARYDSQVEPLVAVEPLRTDYVEVQPGQVRGLKPVAQGHTDEGEFVSLTFVAALDVEAEGDTIRIDGRPSL